MREEARFKNFIIESLFTTNSFLRDNKFFLCKSEHFKFPTQWCSDKPNDTSDIPLDNNGINRINQCNNSLIDELIKDFVCSDLDIIVEPKESLSDTTIANISLIVTLISSKIMMTTTEIETMIAMKTLLYQIVLDQSILMKQLQLRRHPILPQTTMKTWIQK